MYMFWGIAPMLVSLSSFVTYTAAGNTLNASIAFTSVALFNLLRFPLAMLPKFRIKNFFLFCKKKASTHNTHKTNK